MRARIVLGLSLAFSASVSIVSGCSVAPPPTPLARDYGVAHELAVLGQIANPAAEENLAPVEGTDGKTALGSYNRYRSGLGYTKDMDSSVFDIRPIQQNSSEITIKGDPGVKPNILYQPK